MLKIIRNHSSMYRHFGESRGLISNQKPSLTQPWIGVGGIRGTTRTRGESLHGYRPVEPSRSFETVLGGDAAER